MCEPAVLLSVPDVTVPFSLVNVNSEVLFDSSNRRPFVSPENAKRFCGRSRRHEW